MIYLKMTSFHIDFSTLEMERGKMPVVSTGITYVTKPATVPPLIKLEGMLIDKDVDLKDSTTPKGYFEKRADKVLHKNKKLKA